jgi:hypothetical protein
VSGGRRTNRRWSENEYRLWLRVPSPNCKQWTNKGGGYIGKAGHTMREAWDDTRAVFKRRFANDEVISDWQARSDGGLLTNRDGQMKQGLKDGSECDSSEYSAASTRMGTLPVILADH